MKTFRVPGAAALGRDRVVALGAAQPTASDEGALCVPAELPLSAGG